MNSIRAKIRQLLGDVSTIGSDVFTYGSSKVFTLSESNIISITAIFKNDVELSDSYFSFDSSTNKLTVVSSLNSGDIIEVKYTYYPNYSTTEITNYVQCALVHLSINNYYDFSYDSADDAIYPEVEPREENMIAIIAALLMTPENKSISLPDISIRVPNDLPINEKIRKMLVMFKHDTHGVFSILY